MRIALFGSFPPRKGGIETFLAAFAPTLVRRGHEVLVISDADADLDEPREGGYRVIGSPMTKPMQDMDVQRISDTAKKIGGAIGAFAPDILHFHPSGPELMILEIATRGVGHIPQVMTLHSTAFGDDKSVTMLRFLQRAARVTAVSPSTANALGPGGKAAAGAVEVINNALPPGPQPQSYPDDLHILGMGRLSPEKGFDTLIRAMRVVQERCPGCTLTLAGIGPELPRLRRLAQDILPHPDQVIFPGWVDGHNKRELLDKSRMLVVPSVWEEPFGLVVLEAAQAGRPVIVTERGALPHIAPHNVSGLVVAAEAPLAMAEAILELLNEPKRAASLGETAHSRALKLHDHDLMMDHYEYILRAAATKPC